ncbi:DUF2911 domain-containing protein [Muriicola sp. Z0-33]|uniref:DUF2911 domain-containing protein n=1 Tax=Muriicola sp. Z0-33 TaxID=2816957 RepID=UPI002238289B|nr:DUF2911 domain-containing protein [Muriicola sp. Z0-33]MCW5515409.1 DUF2911 domain-containing protein [Muriicola sp. Z0-33]
MKNCLIYTTLFLAITFGCHSVLTAQEVEIPRASPKASISQTIGVCKVTVDYSRPGVRDRTIFGGLVPNNKVWRAGANEATVISFNYEIKFGGQKVAPGKYGLFMIPRADNWIVILNKDWGQWGAYNYSNEDDVLRIEISPQKADFIELCTYSFTGVDKTSGNLNMDWEHTRISIPLTTEAHTHTLAEIEKGVSSVKSGWYNFSAAAQYHFYERKEAAKALEYIDMAIALKAPNPAPWMLKSQILASEGKYNEAIDMAEKAILVSKKHNFLFEIEENEENIHKWKNR